MQAHKICYFAGVTNDRGGAGRVLFTNLRLIDRSRFSPIVLLPGHGKAKKMLDELDISYQVWGSLTEFSHPLTYGKAIIRATLWFRQQKVELVHINRANDWRSAELLAARLCRIPVIYHFHMVNRDNAPATRMATAIVAVSRYVAENSHTFGVPTKVIYNPVDFERFDRADSIRAPLDLDKKHVVVTFVGQVRKIKGIEDFIAMARQVTGEQVRFLIVGHCRDERSFTDAFTEEELYALMSYDSRIRYYGYQTKIQDIYHASDIVVVPSRCEEAFGLVAAEAGAAGKAVVANRVGGIPEVIVDKETGYLVEAGDVQDMVYRVQQLVDSPALRSTLGNAARARIYREFTTKPVRALEACYETLLSRA
jgi:glycosyltransferase involved in cell wall biosynthesis